jgi:hypothetical protein
MMAMTMAKKRRASIRLQSSFRKVLAMKMAEKRRQSPQPKRKIPAADLPPRKSARLAAAAPPRKSARLAMK